MNIKINKISQAETDAWDTYVNGHPKATLYHLSAWKKIIKKTYGHKTYYLLATKSNSDATDNGQQTTCTTHSAIGILPLIQLKHFIFGNSLISIPFFDIGGILADDEETEKALLSEAVKIGHKIESDTIELRHIQPLTWLGNSSHLTDDRSHRAHSSKEEPGIDYEPSTMSHEPPPISYATRSHKVRMLLALPESSEALMKSFKSKLRSQIKKPIKEGLKSKVGSLELLDDFYKVFSINMRDLGSPLHSRKLIKHVLEEFSEKARIVLVYKDSEPLACSIIVGFNDTLENPWASALRQYSRLSPNMLLYWTMLEYACNNGYKYFDFGRSTPDEGTYKFKKQWGAKPEPLHWHFISLNGQPINEDTSEKSKFDKAIHYWQKLPVSVTKILGPMIRKHIGL